MENIELIIKALECTRWIWSLLATKSTDETPDEADARKRELLAFQGRLVALEVGIRRLVAWSQNSDRDVKEGISTISRHFKENPDEAAKGISRTYPEYDPEMAKILVHHIAESLESFLPIRMSGVGNTTVGGSSSPTPTEGDGSTPAE